MLSGPSRVPVPRAACSQRLLYLSCSSAPPRRNRAASYTSTSSPNPLLLPVPSGQKSLGTQHRQGIVKTAVKSEVTDSRWKVDSPIIHLLLVTSLATGPGLLTVWIAVICLAPTLFRRCPICFSLASTFDKLPSIPPLRLLGLVLSCIFCRPVTCLALASCITRSFLFHFLVSVVSRAG